MADRPAIVALAPELWRTSCADVLNRRMVNMGEWGEQGPDVQSGFPSLARAAYAAVLRDLMLASEAKLVVNEMLRARAREIGVEVE